MFPTVPRFHAAAFTPLHVRWPYPLQEITRGIRIVEKPTFNETTWDFWNLRRTEVRDALERRHWLFIEEDCAWHERDGVLHRLMTALRNAMVGFQLWCPQGWDGLLIGAHRTDTGLNVETVEVAGQYLNSRWGVC